MGKSPDSPSDSEDDDIIDEPMRDSQNGSVNDHQSNLSEEAQRRVVRVILKLASKAQFSKVIGELISCRQNFKCSPGQGILAL